MEKTRLSNKGQVVIPKAVRLLYGWNPGLEFVIERAEDGIKLKPVNPFAETTVNEVLGCIEYKGPVKSLRDMDDAIAKGAKKAK